MDTDEQNEIYMQVSDLWDVYYDELTEDEQAQVDLTALEKLSDYFSGAIMLTTTETSEELSAYIDSTLMVFDIADSYESSGDSNGNSSTYPNGWTSDAMVSFDNATYHYLGINGNLTMSSGYGAGCDWVAMQFYLSINGTGDNIIRDIDGNSIIGYCYVKGTDGLWVGHGERSFGGTITDSYGTARLSNYLKTEIASGSASTTTGRATFSETDVCTIIIDNEIGTVAMDVSPYTCYSGAYYTVKTYVSNTLISTEYYSGTFNGIGSIETTATQYFGGITIYASNKTRVSANEATSDDYLLFAADFDDQAITADVGIATEVDSGSTTITYSNDTKNNTGYSAYLDGTTYISATKSDGTPLLRGTDTATISMKAKLSSNSGNQWYFYTSWTSSKPTSDKRSYIGLYHSSGGSSMVAERFRDNSGTPTIEASTSFDNWHDITYIIDGYIAEIYVDGVYAGSADYSECSGQEEGDHLMSTILGTGTSTVTYFGKSAWTDPLAKGYFDDIAVYNFAPSIDLSDIDWDNITSDISLPTASESSCGYSIEWESSDTSVISDGGKVTRPTDKDATVTLTATITYGDTTLKREFTATVLADSSNSTVVKGKNIELKNGEIIMKVYVDNSSYNTEGTLSSTVGGETVYAATCSDNTSTVDSNTVYTISQKVLPTQMADDIVIKIPVSGGTLTYTTSVKEYAEAALTTASDNEKAVLNAMLDYGSAVQTLADYNTSSLANSGTYQTTNISTVDYISLANDSTGATKKSSTSDNSEWSGAKLSSMNMNFNYNFNLGLTYSGSLENYTVKVTLGTTEYTVTEIAGDTSDSTTGDVVFSSDKKSIIVKNLSAADLLSTLSISLTPTDTNSSTTYTTTTKPIYYARLLVTSGTENQKLVGQTLYLYAKAVSTLASAS